MTMDRKEYIRNFVDAIVKDDMDAAKQAAHQMSVAVVKQAISEPKNEKIVSENYKQFLKLIRENEYDVSLNGDNVVVNGKLVGKIINDLSDDSPIMFISADRKLKKEFDTVQDLFSFIENSYIKV
jgi:hypothetical protein